MFNARLKIYHPQKIPHNLACASNRSIKQNWLGLLELQRLGDASAMLVYKTLAKCRSFCIIIESKSQKTFFAVVLYTTMAAMASHENLK